MAKELYYSPEMDRLTPKEQELLDKDVKFTKRAVLLSAKVNGKRYATRNAHAKAFGYVRGKFIPVKNNAGDISELLQGNNLGVIIRYSHPNFFTLKNGPEYPLYGCSVKIYNKSLPVSARFPLVNLPVFITNSVSKFLNIHINANRFFISRGKIYGLSFLKIPGLVLAGLSLFWDRQILSILRNTLRVLDIEKRFIATYAYHSVGCYRLGDKVVKIRLKPTKHKNTPEEPLMDQTQKLFEYFSAEELSLDFQVQVGTTERKTPVNNLLKIWSERSAKFVTVGRIVLPKQDISEYRRMAYENLSFNPFENADELKPVGRMQKVRQKIYNASIAARQHYNQTANVKNKK